MNRRIIRTFSNNKDLIIERRKLIVNHAIRLFYEKGYNQCGIRDIAKACGMTTGLIYHYIGSKSDILHLIIKHSEDQIMILQRVYKKNRACCFTEILRMCINEYLNNLVIKDRYILIEYNRELKYFSQSDRDYLLRSYEKTVEFFEELLMKGRNIGEFEFNFSPKILALNIVEIGHSFLKNWWLIKKHYTADEYVKQQINIIIRTIIRV